jgi:hypothetical protein
MKELDLQDLEQCRIAILSLWSDIVKRHGPVVAQRLFAERVMSPQTARDSGNDWLLIQYIRSGLSVKRFAAQFAEKNKTSAEAVEKQIQRQKKTMTPKRREFIQYAAKYFADIS